MSFNQNKSIAAFSQAKKVMPGGVNSPVRAFGSVSGEPVLIDSAQGCRVRDIDGNEYIDFVGSWGPMIIGHAHEAIIEAVKKAAEKGTSFGAPTEGETGLAQLIIDMVPSIESVRLVNSGTEATMSAIRLARGYTGRDKIIKFIGNYHGHADSFLIQAGSGAMTMGVPNSPGVTKGTAADTMLAEFNDISSVEKLFEQAGQEIAAVIIEPVAGNMGVVPPADGFLQALRDLTTSHGAVLIFDEVMTGFRVAAGGAQQRFGITPDLTTMGKVIGGGLPVGAYGGKKEIMSQVAPEGPVYQAGTLSGNPLAVAAGLAMLETINSNSDFYKELEKKSEQFADGLVANAKEAGIKTVLNRVGSMMTVFFTEADEVSTYAHAAKSDTEKYGRSFWAHLKRGMYTAPSQFEALFISMAHTQADLDRALEINREALRSL